MSFVLKKAQSFFWPVKIKLPANGQYETSELELEFKAMTGKDVEKLSATEGSDDSDFVKNIVIGWKSVTNEDGVDVPFSKSALSDLLSVMGVSSQIAMQYMDIFRSAVTKN